MVTFDQQALNLFHPLQTSNSWQRIWAKHCEILSFDLSVNDMFNVPKKEEQLEIQVKREHLFILCLISSSKFLVSHLRFILSEISGCWPIGLLLLLYLQMFTSLLYMIALLPLSTNKISSESKFSSFYIPSRMYLAMDLF